MKLYLTLWNIRIFHLFISILIAILPIFLLVIFLYFQTVTKLQDKVIASTRQSLQIIENMFAKIDQDATSFLTITNKPCKTIEHRLTNYTVKVPFVRTINLTKSNIIYCSSFFGAYHRSTFLEKNQLMQLFSNNDITPDRSFLYYHKTKGQWGVLIAIDGTYLAYLLRNDNPNSYLVIGNNWLDIKGVVRSPMHFKSAQDRFEITSKNYPFKVVSILSIATYFEYMFERYLLFLLIFSLIMVATGIQFYMRLPIYDIVRAMRHKQFVPYYQLIKTSNSPDWCGAEVLVRWLHPTKGLIMPNEFIPRLEKSKYIIPFTLNLMEQVKTEIMRHIEYIPKGFNIGINISPKHLQSVKLAADCKKFLEPFPNQYICLTLEITEREIAEPTAITNHLFKQLQDIKVLVSIDDFGTGHASLSYLQNFKVDSIKIDRSFVCTLADNSCSQYIINSIIELANNLEVDIVAEGVETDHQQQYLTERGVKYLQGFLFSKPAPITEVCQILAETNSTKQ